MRCAIALVLTVLFISPVSGQDWGLSENPELAAWFEHQVRNIESQTDLFQYETLDDWQAARPEMRRQLFEMLGLDPLPERGDLQVQVTGSLEEMDFEMDFVVENLHFQSSPGLYVTGNLYRPKHTTGPLPAVLYVCGHGGVKRNGVSLGNKTHYHRHGCWFARNGYICLTIDTLQLGEIEAIHHGTYRYGRWWWNARGYTPAGIEAWNCIRALDYLQSRPDVDGSRLGVTGRSGGGAYSWWIAALDDRIQCAIPVAGITSLRNHVVDGCVEGHCDCMYLVNTYRWDYPLVAALVAPRPLLISNSDKDRIFPLDGVIDVHRQVAHVYKLYGKSDQLGLNITEGPHKDTQELRVHAFRWLNRWLKDDADSLISKTADPYFEPEQLRVFADIPQDEMNTTIDETFVPVASEPFQSPGNNKQQLDLLKQKCFAAWPDLPPADIDDDSVTIEEHRTADPPNGGEAASTTRIVRFNSEPHVPLTLKFQQGGKAQQDNVTKVTLLVFATQEPDQFDNAVLLSALRDSDQVLASFNPRGTGKHAWHGNDKKQTQIRRRFQLVGTTLEAMQAWDIRRALQLCRSMYGDDVEVVVRCDRKLMAETICALLFEPRPYSLVLPSDSADFTAREINIFNLTKTVDVSGLTEAVLSN